MPRHLIAPFAALAIAACSPAADEPEPEAEASATPAAGGMAGSPIELTPLTPQDVADADLKGELGCSFTAENGDMLLLAMGNVADAKGHALGLAKRADAPQLLTSTEAGGYDPLPDGTSFTGSDMSYEVALTSTTAAGEGESPPFPAELRLNRQDGAMLTIPGRWTCGP
ncbi:conserved hypothetical protein [Altererythrobacter sp. B11]|uniref:hypothetical protein n=1 Tax=Altererythrobacter sp. B11 TaxID=2060312 RepID=UPI000DC6E7AF|nr:hypothetical protein [Altererythrobacter sp. B11]BBC70921.1 conserved hypothetical protein [Altererythrobacter sp. B11]